MTYSTACIAKWRQGQRPRFDGGEARPDGYTVATVYDGDVTTYAYEVHPTAAGDFFDWATVTFADGMPSYARLVGAWPSFQVERASIAEAQAFADDASGEAALAWENEHRPARAAA